MATNILPHKAVNDMNCMYQYLKQKLSSSLQLTDLIPFINTLLNIDELKIQILTSLNKQYQIENSKQSSSSINLESKSKLRSLFISLFALNGIPSDIIHANIVSFLPSKEYKKLPILSKHFRNIMMNNPFIFNEKGYSVDLGYSMRNFSANKVSKISIKHQNNQIHVFPLNSDEHKTTLSDKTTNKITQFDKIKCWKMVPAEYMYGRLTEEKEDAKPIQDKHNIFISNLILKYNKNIERLDISIADPDIISNIFEKSSSFNQLSVLSLLHLEHNDPEMILNTTSFKNLEYLEFGINSSTNIVDINHILDHSSKSLKALKLRKIAAAGSVYFDSPWDVTRLSGDKEIKLPTNIEWISMTQLGLTLDMTECNKLIGVTLLCVDPIRILWPKHKDEAETAENLIPFVCVGDIRKEIPLWGFQQIHTDHNHWRDKVMNKEINAKFVLLKKVYEVVNDENSINSWGSHNDIMLSFNDDTTIKRISIDDYMSESNKDDGNKCLVLQKWNINLDLFYKIMKYAIKDDNLRDQKYKIYNKWKNLRCAQWIHDLDDQTCNKY